MREQEILKAVRQIGKEVYLKTDEYQMTRLVVEVVVRAKDIKFMLSCGPELTMHYDFEITTEKAVKVM
jgi:hypothetical protein